MYQLNYTGRFKKDFKLAQKRNMDLTLLQKAFTYLANDGTLPPAYKMHTLKGNYNGMQECHVTPDWLLVFRIKAKEKEIDLLRLGTHSDLF